MLVLTEAAAPRGSVHHRPDRQSRIRFAADQLEAPQETIDALFVATAPHVDHGDVEEGIGAAGIEFVGALMARLGHFRLTEVEPQVFSPVGRRAASLPERAWPCGRSTDSS